MKKKLSFLVIIIISSIGYFSFVNSESIKIQLIEAKTNSPLKNHEIGIYYYQMIYDSPPKLELIKNIITDNNGNFELQRKIFRNKEIGIKCGENYKISTISIRDNQIWFFRYKNGFGQTISRTRYDLETMKETNFTYYNDTIYTEFDRIELFAYDKVDYWTKLKERIKENQTKFEVDQKVLWYYLWTEFEKSVDGKTIPPFNSNHWYKFVVTSMRLFELDLKTAFNETKKITDSNKLYYHLYSLCFIINAQKEVINEPEKEIVDWIKKEVKKFYKENSYLDLKNEKLPRDVLLSTYKAMIKNIEN